MRIRIPFLLLSIFPLATYSQTKLPDSLAINSPSVFNLLSVSDKPYNLTKFLRVFEDSTRSLTIHHVSSPGFAKRFHENKFDRKTWQNQSYMIWAWIGIKNSSGKSQRIYLSGGFGDTIIGYKQTGEQSFESRFTGKLVPLLNNGNTLIPHSDFEYMVDAGETVTLFFRLSQDNYEWLPNEIPFNLYTYSAITQFQKQLRISWMFNGLYFGIAILMFVYTLALLIIFREKAYLWLALFQLSNILYFLDNSGIGFNLLYPGNTMLFKYGSALFLWGIVFWHFMFIASYLEIRKFFPKIYYALLMITLIAAFSRLIFWAIGYYLLGKYIEDLGILAMIISLFAVVFYMAFRLNMRLAKILIFGEVSIAIAGIISGLTFTHLINFPSNYAMNILQAGFTLQMLLWTVAIVDKIILLRKEKEQSQARELEMAYANEQLIRDQNILLEKKVEERTHKLKETQSQLIQSEKMASLGMLTAGIAHEINNPVNFINSGAISLEKDYIDLQQIIQSIEQLPPDTQKLADKLGMDELLKNIPQTIEDIKTGVHRTSEIVKGLRNFTRMEASELKEADLHEGIDSTLLLLGHKLKDRIPVVKDYDERIGSIKCFPGPLNQVFMNLLNNAIDAIEQKIKEDSTGGISTDKPISNYHFQIGITTKLMEEGVKKQVKIVVSDNGVGVSDGIKDKLFDPFFTTKEVGKGTGLGLSICHGIIEKHGGSISFESKVNEGSVFTIILPGNI